MSEVAASGEAFSDACDQVFDALRAAREEAFWFEVVVTRFSGVRCLFPWRGGEVVGDRRWPGGELRRVCGGE